MNNKRTQESHRPINAGAKTGRRMAFSSGAVLAVFLSLASLAEAQTLPKKPSEKEAVQAEESYSTQRGPDSVVQLSPFVVSASPSDTRYYTGNTLAGTRLNTDVSDLAASITVVTRQQLLDTASVNMNDVFLYEANTEGAATYTSYSIGDTGAAIDNNATSPTGANRVRGIGAVDLARNYYPSISQLPFDAYNTETVEINRGPNSLLFGLGSPSGIVNQSASRAVLGQKHGEISARYGSEDSYRASLRVNQPLGSKAAIFAAGLYDSKQFSQKPSYSISRRGYLAGTYSPFKTVTIRANYEKYSNDNQLPSALTANDLVTPWRQAGSPTWDPLTLVSTSSGVSQAFTSPAVVPGLGVGLISAFPAMYFPAGSSSPQLWMQQSLSTGGITGAFNTSFQLAANGSTISKNQGLFPLYVVPGVSSKSVYDWSSINLNAGNTTSTHADIYNVEVEGQILPHLFAQAGWYRESFDNSGYMGTGNILQIDPNVKLLDGTNNPYFGAPFMEHLTGANVDLDIKNDNWKVNLAYEHDFTSSSNWMRWLGHHRLAAFGTKRQLDTTTLYSQGMVTDDHAWVNSSNRTLVAVGRPGAFLDRRFYVGGTDGIVRTGPSEAAFGTADIPLRWASFANGAYTWTNEATKVSPQLIVNSTRSKQTTNSLTLASQSSFWDDKIVVTLGFRRDQNLGRNSLGLVLDPATGFYNPGNLNTFGMEQKIYGNTRTGGVVVKPFKGVSLYYGQSRNFAPAPLEYDLFSQPLPLPSGKGKDYGIRLEAIPGKLIVGIDLYKASGDNARGTPATTFIQRTARFDNADFTNRFATPLVTAQLGAGATPDQISAGVLAILKFPNNQRPPAEITLSSTSSVESHGAEGLVIFTPVPNWNIKATFGRQVTTYSNIAPEFDAWVSQRMPIWTGTINPNTGLSFWNGIRAGTQTEAAWFQLNVLSGIKLAQALKGKQTAGQREWGGALISNYRFTEGSLRGLEVGGGARWQSKAVIGYLGAAPEADGVVRALDENKPVYDKSRIPVDLWLSYNYQLPWLSKKMRTKLQLNVRDAFAKEGLDVVGVNPDGGASLYRIRTPREWYLTTTLEF